MIPNLDTSKRDSAADSFMNEQAIYRIDLSKVYINRNGQVCNYKK